MQVIDKEKYFNHKTAGALANIKVGAKTWLHKTETTEAILTQALLLSELLSKYAGYKDGREIIKEIHRLCLLLPDDGQKYTAILKRDADKILSVYNNIDE